MDWRKVVAISILVAFLLLNATGQMAETIPPLLHSTTPGDFNGDGILDVAAVDLQAAVSIFLGQGEGVLQAPVSVPTGSMPVALIAGDFNGDRITDLATANEGSGGSVSILVGLGDGTFGSHEDYLVGFGPTRIIAADMNGDGHLDLATTNVQGQSVSILTGSGDATFQRASDIPISSNFGQIGLAVGDFDGDSIIDLAVTNRVGVDVMLGIGDGTFRSPLTAGTMSAWDVVAVDINGDRALDLAAISDEGITPMFGQGDGTFRLEATVSLGLEARQHRPLIATDFNRDGYIDLAASGDSLSVLVGRGDQSFEPAIDYPIGSNIRSLSTGDFNNDGLLDFAVQTDFNVSVLFQAVGSTVSLQSSLNPAVVGQSVTLTASVGSAEGGIQSSSNFPAPAQNPLSESGKWVTPINAGATGAIQKNAAGNILGATAGRHSMARFVGLTFMSDQFSQATITARNGNTRQGVAVRIQSNSNASAYALLDSFGTSYNIVRLGDLGNDLRFVSPTLASFPITPQTGDVIRLKVVGTVNPVLTAYRNGIVMGSVTDTGTTDWSGTYPPLTGGQPGVYTFVSNGTALTASQLTAWSGGDLFSADIPSGTVTFKNGATTLGSSALNASAQATLVTGFPIGSHPLTAIYNGDAVFGSGTSPVVDQIVTLATTSTTLTSGPNPSAVGQPVTFTATVTAPSGTPTGTVVFRDAGVQIGTGSVNASNQAVFVTTTLAGGPHSMTANYVSNGILGGSTSPVVNHVVTQTATSTALTSSMNPSPTGQSLTFTAVVSSTAGIPAGTVTFKDGATTIGTGVLAAGQATFSTAALAIGTHSITAVYGAAGVYASSTSGALSQVITPPLTPTSTALVSSLNPSTTGQSVTFTASVTSSSGTPTGTVTFKDGAATLGAIALNGAGQAAYSTSALGAVPHSITAVYGGSATLASSTSPVVNQVVTASGTAATATSLVSSLNPSSLGQTVTLIASVSPGGAGGALASSSFPAPAENPLSETGTWITPVNPNATLAVQKNGINQIHPTAAGKAAMARYVGTTFTGDQFSQATISARGGSTIEGVAVRIQSNSNSSGYALLDVFGAYSIVRMADKGNELRFVGPRLATFAGPAVAGDVIRLEITGSVNPTLTAYRNGVLLGSAIDTGVSDWSGNYPPLTGGQPGVYLFMSNGGAITGVRMSTWSGGNVVAGASAMTGSVTFKDGAATLGTASINAIGQATLNTSAMAIGTHPLTAVYGGDSAYSSSTSDAVNQVVNIAGSTTALTSSNNPSTSGQSVTFTATVTGTNGIPTGLVTFNDGVTPLGTGSLNAAGVATFSTALTTGTHPMTAVFAGDAGLTGSTSAILNQVVNPGTQTETSTTTVTSSPNPSTKGQAITFTAHVTPSAGVATGTVTFHDSGVAIGSATLNAAGDATLVLTLQSAGTRNITASWGGTSVIFGSTSSVLEHVVNRAPTITTMTTLITPTAYGQEATFRIAVTSGAGQPPYTVTLKDGATTIGTATPDPGFMHAYLMISSLSSGTHSVTAVYAGDANYLPSTSAPVTHVVNQGVSSTAVSSSLNPSPLGQSVTLTANITPATVNSGTVTFMDGASTLGTGAVSAGQATFATTALSMGTHPITAVFAGASEVVGSTSPVLSQVVTPPATTTTLMSSQNPSVSGQAVTFTATVTSGVGTPGGFVVFNNGVTPLATVALNGTGQASHTTSALPIGTHPITAVYGGSASHTGSSSAVLTQSVNSSNRVGTFTSITSSLNPSQSGQSVTFTASVASTGGGVAQVSSNFNAPAQNPLSEGGNWATPLNPSSTAAVQKDANNRVFPTAINRDAMARYVGATLSENQFSQATIAARNGNTIEGVTVRGQSNSNGASYALLDYFGEHYSIVRLSEYAGDIRFAGPRLMDFVPDPAAGDVIRLEIAGSPNPTLKAFLNGVLLGSVVDTGRSDWAGTYPPLSGGQPGIYMFTSGTPTSGAALTNWSGGDLASGTVVFKDGATTLGSAPLNAAGKATFTTSALTVGSHAITAEYSGDANFLGSTSSVLSQVVNTAIVELFNPSYSGYPVVQAVAERRDYEMILNDERSRLYIRRTLKM